MTRRERPGRVSRMAAIAVALSAAGTASGADPAAVDRDRTALRAVASHARVSVVSEEAWVADRPVAVWAVEGALAPRALLNDLASSLRAQGFVTVDARRGAWHTISWRHQDAVYALQLDVDATASRGWLSRWTTALRAMPQAPAARRLPADFHRLHEFASSDHGTSVRSIVARASGGLLAAAAALEEHLRGEGYRRVRASAMAAARRDALAMTFERGSSHVVATLDASSGTTLAVLHYQERP